jgi:hypothetical protein
MTPIQSFQTIPLIIAALLTGCAGPGVSPSGPALPPDPQVYGRGIWHGTAVNTTFRLRSPGSLVISNYDSRTGSFSGAMQVDAPQLGSGPVSGTLRDGRVSLLFSPPLMEGSHFTGEGVISGNTVSASYEIPAWRGVPAQKGSYTGKFYPVNDAQIAQALAAAISAGRNEWQRTFPNRFIAQQPAVGNHRRTSGTMAKPPAPKRAPAKPRAYFTHGSSVTEVVAAMGDPSAVVQKGARTMLYYYGASSVVFTDDKVTDWENKGGNLKMKQARPNP